MIPAEMILYITILVSEFGNIFKNYFSTEQTTLGLISSHTAVKTIIRRLITTVLENEHCKSLDPVTLATNQMILQQIINRQPID